MAKRPRVVNNKARGKKLEAEVVELAKDYNLHAVRSWGSDGRSLGLDEEVDVVLAKRIEIQCKRKKKLPKFLSGKISHVVIREDNGKHHILIPLRTFLYLVASLLYDRGHINDLWSKELVK